MSSAQAPSVPPSEPTWPVPRHRLRRRRNYDRFPTIPGGEVGACVAGWPGIGAHLRGTGARRIVVEAYPGVLARDLGALAAAAGADLVIDAAAALKPPAEIDAMVHPDLGDDPVFGRLTQLEIEDFFDPAALARLRAQVEACPDRVLVTGTGASLVCAGDLLVYADMPRWEAQQRQRRGAIGNLGAGDTRVRPSQLYKRAYFVDWRVADRLKRRLFDRMDFVLDTTSASQPLMVAACIVFDALHAAARRPFRVVPFFDPGPWGGQWMKQVFGLDGNTANYAWCFDCVPEENSLLLSFGAHRVEIPSINLVYRHPIELLGAEVQARFGDEFPIRFDLLDCVEGGNLSLQVHPLPDYIREHFGLHYTQDESYYILDATEEATVYLGVRSGTDPAAMIAALRDAAEGGAPFDAERFVNRFPARRHDHFLIPAGTVHCSGAGALVLEISATPYIFTFKLWDWDRLGLDGRPRPIHVDHGAANIRFERDTEYARRALVNHVTPLGDGPGWRAERTGLHEAEFIDTHRHWFTAPVLHDTNGGVNVLNLVEGDEAVVESPAQAFEPFVVHFAETFIIPASVGPYLIRPSGRLDGGAACATVKAFVRSSTVAGTGT
jgi:mannose-6-phosphate isomerase class I